ncbi:MAG: transposase [Myxococcota bacterium]
MTYDEKRGKVIYQARRTHGLKGTDTQEFEPVEFIGALARHIPPPNKHQVRYYGAAHRDFRAEMRDGWVPPGTSTSGERLEEGRASWARLIWRVYGVDPLICPTCGKRMRIISIILHDSHASPACCAQNFESPGFVGEPSGLGTGQALGERAPGGRRGSDASFRYLVVCGRGAKQRGLFDRWAGIRGTGLRG